MTHGTEVVEDCLSLLAHLLRFNVSNQSFFRETGCVKKLTKLLSDCEQESEGDEPAPPWALVHRDKNVWGLLAIIQLFLVRGGVGTPANQTSFWQNGVTEQVLSIAFGQKFSVNVTSKVRLALMLCCCTLLILSRLWRPALILFEAIRLYKRDSETSRSHGDLAHAMTKPRMDMQNRNV